jgi:hypothetical protein
MALDRYGKWDLSWGLWRELRAPVTADDANIPTRFDPSDARAPTWVNLSAVSATKTVTDDSTLGLFSGWMAGKKINITGQAGNNWAPGQYTIASVTSSSIIVLTADPTIGADTDAAGQGQVPLSPGVMVETFPASALLLRAFGTDAAAETCTLTVSLWSPVLNAQQIFGPGLLAWKGQLTLGAKNVGGGTSQEPFPGWVKATTWYEVDSWNSGVSGGINAVGASIYTGVNMQALYLPLLGARWAMLHFSNMGGMAKVGLAGLSLTHEGVGL